MMEVQEGLEEVVASVTADELGLKIVLVGEYDLSALSVFGVTTTLLLKLK
jgi:hypothetical protein